MKGKKINLLQYKSFIVTGLYYNSNKRFSSTYPATEAGFHQAMGINLWRGSVWGKLLNGRRELLKRVYN